MLNYSRNADKSTGHTWHLQKYKIIFSEGRLAVIKGAKWIYNEEGHEIQQSESFYDNRCLDLYSNFFWLKFKHWSEFWPKDLWWGLGSSVLLVTYCRAWHCTPEVPKWEWSVIVTDVNIVRIDVEERKKEQQHSEWEHTVSVLCLSALLEHSGKMSLMFRCLWS